MVIIKSKEGKYSDFFIQILTEFVKDQSIMSVIKQ